MRYGRDPDPESSQVEWDVHVKECFYLTGCDIKDLQIIDFKDL